MLAELRIEAQELIYPQPRQKKWDGQPRRVEAGKKESLLPTAARRRKADDAAEDGADARRPACGEGHPQGHRTQHPARLMLREHARVFVERADLQKPYQLQPE